MLSIPNMLKKAGAWVVASLGTFVVHTTAAAERAPQVTVRISPQQLEYVNACKVRGLQQELSLGLMHNRVGAVRDAMAQATQLQAINRDLSLPAYNFPPGDYTPERIPLNEAKRLAYQKEAQFQMQQLEKDMARFETRDAYFQRDCAKPLNPPVITKPVYASLPPHRPFSL
jgi:hypothetical protein